MKFFLLVVTFIAWGAIGFAQNTSVIEQSRELLSPQNYQSLTNTLVYRVDSVYCYDGDLETGNETPSIRQFNTAFSETGQILTQLEQRYFDNTWVNSKTREYVYDSNDFLIEQTETEWEGDSSGWINSTKTILIPDAIAPEYSEIIFQNWENNTWTNTVRTVNAYNAADILIQSDGYLWENEEWVQDYANYFSVNVETNLTVATLFQKRNETGQLANLNRSFLFYDDNENLIEETRDNFQGAWVPSTRSLFIIENDLVIEKSDQFWNQATEEWQNQMLTETNYSFFDKPFQEVQSTWDNESQEYNFFFRKTNSYDTNENLIEFSNELFYNEDWAYVGKCEFFWSEYDVVNTAEIILENCKIPNPYSSNTTFSCSDWDVKGEGLAVLFDLNGRSVLSEKVANKNEIKLNTKSLNGLYILVLRDRRGVVWRKKVVVGN